MNYKLYTDGGARGNPGPAGIGVVLYQDNEIIYSQGFYIGEATNNQAEYQAVIKGLAVAKEKNIKKLTVFMDSELIVSQLNGKYKIKNEQLAKFFVQAYNLTLSFQKISFHHVSRNDNKKADKLVNLAIDKKQEIQLKT